MARPLKDGVDYWPFDVGLLRDKKFKLIKAEFGIKGAYIALELLNSVYESAGYFKKWDDDDCFLMSEGVGCGCTPENIREVLRGCIRRSLFEQGVFDMFGVLTSQGIQRRYLRIVGNNRDEIRIIREYWLLNEGDKNDVPASVLEKLTFFSISLKENPLKSKENPFKSTDNPQRKEKESKVNKRKERVGADAPARSRFVKPTIDEITEYCAQENVQIDAERFFNHYEAVGWYMGKSPMTNWKAAIRNWCSREKSFQSDSASQKRRNEVTQIGGSSLDKSDLMDLVLKNLFSDEEDGNVW